VCCSTPYALSEIPRAVVGICAAFSASFDQSELS
jgi:hypothetical protein